MKNKILAAGLLIVSLVAETAGGMTGSMTKESNVAEAAEASAAVSQAALAADEVALSKSIGGNPLIRTDKDGNRLYGGDPSVLVDGDTVYLYVGHDTAGVDNSNKAQYVMKEWVCYSSKDMVNWNYEGAIMNAGSDIPWTSDAKGESAWAAQMAKHYDAAAGKDRYYFYYCTWDKTSSGKQSIGVAVSDSPTGPFTDKGEPLVKGDLTEPQTSNWNDIDPTVWVETDATGVEHRYLAWGNGKFYLCELNEDMMSVKDLNGDGKITCGTQADSADVLDQSGIASFTEAPWLYRRKDANGNYYGSYYLFYAYGWREQMAYATCDNLLEGKWTFGKVLMPPTATSNTNHMAVFDFNGKTYFVYHNGSLPGGDGYRRSACVTEVVFNEDGSIKEIPETAVGISGTTSVVYTNSGALLSHETYVNSKADGDYPVKNVTIGAGIGTEEKDSQWVIMPGKADTSKAAYVSIQSENKPGLYITANDDGTATLAQDADGTETTAAKQTFRTVRGLSDEKGVSFESVAKPGYYLTISNKILCLTKGDDKVAATFYTGVDQNDASLRSIGVEITKNQFHKGTKITTKNVKVTAFYANGTTQKVTDFTTNASKINTKKAGKKTLQVTYSEGGVERTTGVPVSVVPKPAKVKKLKATLKIKKKTASVTLKWKAAAYGAGYELKYSTKKNKGLQYMQEQKSTRYKGEVPGAKMKKGKTYYFHVRTYAKFNGKREYSKYTTVKVKAK